MVIRELELGSWVGWGDLISENGEHVNFVGYEEWGITSDEEELDEIGS